MATPKPSAARRMSRFFGHMRNALSEASKDARPRTSSGPRPPSKAPPAATATLPPEPDAIFGVSLSKSMQVAKSTARTRHTDSKSPSRREFPLCMLSCATYLKTSGGTSMPDIFGAVGDPRRLAALRAVFSTPPTYGSDVDWALFTPYEASDLMVNFLRELPRPLVSEAVARRWVSLSKQATQTGSDAMRLEQCIDFWEEALGGLGGGAPARSLFKLLLNLWGDVADAAHENDMTAERLAARVVRPLMHTSPSTYDTDYMLGLAFLIRKRSEYGALLAGGTRKSNAAFF